MYVRWGVVLPWESNPSGPLVGRQNGGCWMPFEYAHSGSCSMQLTPCCAESGGWCCRRTPIPCDLPIALRRRSPAGTIKLVSTLAFWGPHPSQRSRPAEGRERYSDRNSWPVDAAQVRFGGSGIRAGAAGGASERTEGGKVKGSGPEQRGVSGRAEHQGCKVRAGSARGVRARGAARLQGPGRNREGCPGARSSEQGYRP
jgi:hypothetical protein